MLLPRKPPRFEPTTEGALIQADWYEENGRYDDADRMRRVAVFQANITFMWNKGGNAWSSRELRALPMRDRLKTTSFHMEGNDYTIEAWFAQKAVTWRLYINPLPDLGSWIKATNFHRKTDRKTDRPIDLKLRTIANTLVSALERK
jgi:hypothetical protein